MATRHLRRLQEQQTPTISAAAESDTETEEQEDTAAPFNPFDLLTDGEDEPAAAEDEQEEDEPQQPVALAPAAVSKAGGSKKKNKKKKGKGKSKDPDDDAAGTSAAPSDSKDEDIDKLLQELNITPAQAHHQPAGSATSADLPPLLAVDPRHLRGDEELRRIFGSEVISAVDREDQAEAQAARRYQGRGQPQRRRPLKRGLLATPKDTWPPLLPGGLSMEPAGIVDGCRSFRYVRSESYKAVQAAFEQCQATFDPNTIAALMQRSPYHIDTLMAMYDLYRHTGDNQYAEEVLARALYVLESAWPPAFDVASCNCRVDYELEENKGLFTALFRHLQALSRKGCHRSALECCKLLLALDPRDPLGALFHMDYLCLRAAQHSYLQRLAREFQHGCSLALLPNFAYSLALARFWQEQQGEQQQQQEERSSQELLVQAILLHPLVVPRLVAKLQGQGVGKDAWWASLLSSRLLQDDGDAGNATLQHLVNLYVERCHLLWKAPGIQAWLKQACDRAVRVAEGRQQAGEAGLGAEDWACVRREAFEGGVAANQYRHLRLHDFSDAVNAIPREELAAAMQAGGPAEVEDLLEELQAMALQQQQAAARRGVQRVGEEELRNANPLLVLLQSLLPWVDAGQQPQYDQQQQEQQPGEQE